MTLYSRSNPSKEYTSLLTQYKILHDTRKKDKVKGPVFSNGEYAKEAPTIKRLIHDHQCETLLNYGCGNPKAFFNTPYTPPTHTDEDKPFRSIHGYLGRLDVSMYDPGIEKLSMYPYKQSDIVVCTDVLEHIPPTDIPWFLKELIYLSGSVLHVTIHLGPAFTLLPDGRNAHACIRPGEWWNEKIATAIKETGRDDLIISKHFRYPLYKDGSYVKVDYAHYQKTQPE